MFWIIGIILMLLLFIGAFDSWFGFFGDTFYTSKKKSEPEKPKPKHKSFHLTKED
jgi:hypothetical protein